MLRKQVWTSVLSLAAISSAASAASAAVFMQDDFDYAVGQLTAADSGGFNGTGANVSGGAWNTHSGAAEFIQVAVDPADAEDGVAVVQSSGTEDVSRTAGGQTLQAGQTWYYGARMTINDRRPANGTGDFVNDSYFMHFKDEGTFNLLGRLWIQQPASGPGTAGFRLSVSSYSVNPDGGQRVPWAADLAFGGEYTVIVSITAKDELAETTTDGYASLWVNPTSQASTSVTDTMPHPDFFLANTDPNTPGPTRDRVTRLALRQQNVANFYPEFLVDEVAIGDNFADVLAAVSLTPAPANNADFDTSGTVDGKDFLTWQAGYGLTGQTGKTTGNANTDTVVDDLDFAEWKAKFGGAPVAAAGSAVPEPTSLAMAALTLAALGAARRRA